MTTLTIKHIKVNQNGNEISGNTFLVKEYIKAHLAGKWNSGRRAWTIDTAKLQDLIEKGCIYASDEKPAEHKQHNGVCPKCGTYCYGDCSAH